VKTPDTVEEWGPMFLVNAHFSQDQVLNPSFAIFGTYCKLCDAHITGRADAHMKAHRDELTKWLARRKREASQRSKKGLAQWRQEQELAAKSAAAEVIEHADEYE
jgi:hypothetical protein